ncbi:hypothetical protein J2Z79_002631 [Symbiobacterium terraclitae]|uniref:Integral membrane protein n=1 Tax=Symbiobacterium terraclitae TaxID=557451 RepID=A0ABS4JW55_9FIRM|nr:hypothetical protein [Symbiobacterium terraclitae]MBP2019206.1 hypothetical protein [Symbiobacterium terraclitae]
MRLLERAFAVWRRYWWSLVLAHVAVDVGPVVLAAAMGRALGLFPGGIQDPLRTVLFEQYDRAQLAWMAILTSPAGLLTLLTLMLLYLLAHAGLIGVLRALVRGGRRPTAADFLRGVRQEWARLLKVRLLSLLPLGVAALAAALATVLAGVVLASWLVPLVPAAIMLVGEGAVLYAYPILVAEEDATATEAVQDSVAVLLERWKEAVGAAVVFELITGMGPLGGRLLARVEGPLGVLLGALPVVLCGSLAMVYLVVRFIENVHRGLFERDGEFAIDHADAGWRTRGA